MIPFEWTLVEMENGRWYMVDSNNGQLINWCVNFWKALQWTVEWYNFQLDASPDDIARIKVERV